MDTISEIERIRSELMTKIDILERYVNSELSNLQEQIKNDEKRTKYNKT